MSRIIISSRSRLREKYHRIICILAWLRTWTSMTSFVSQIMQINGYIEKECETLICEAKGRKVNIASSITFTFMMKTLPLQYK